MYVTENGTYIEEAEAAMMTDYGDFIRLVDEHGAVVLLSKDLIRDAHNLHNLLEYITQSEFNQGESK